MVEQSTGLPCPVCDHRDLTLRWVELEIPYFGTVTQTTLLCKACSYKHNDILLGELKDPLRITFPVTGEQDMSVKVVRSASATVSVPELGLMVEPGITSEGYISNVEGVLQRFRGAVEQAIRFAAGTEEETTARENGLSILGGIDEVISGTRTVTLVIEDPYGNSAIISPRAVTEPIPAEEAERLKQGFPVFEMA